MKLVNIDRILKFKQSDWLKKYIDFNIDKRKNAANSTFGKIVETFRKIINFRLVNNAEIIKNM